MGRAEVGNLSRGLLLRDRGKRGRGVSSRDVLQRRPDPPSAVRGWHVQFVPTADGVRCVPGWILLQSSWINDVQTSKYMPSRTFLYSGDEESGGGAVSAGDVQQHDGADQHHAVQAVPGGDVLRGDGADSAERQVQRRLLLQRGGSGGERELV